MGPASPSINRKRLGNYVIEIISIGSELLTGQTINTSASVIATLLVREGYLVKQITTIPDEQNALKEALHRAAQRVPFIMMTGGLGPTEDDITRQTLAEFFKCSLKKDDTLAFDLIKRYGKELQTLEDQATVIEGATIMPNLFGTAPGFLLKKGKTTVLAFPGVPHQMREMLEKYGIPYLSRVASKAYFQQSLFLFSIAEKSVDLTLQYLKQKYPHLEYGLCPSRGTLSIYLKVKASSQKEASEKLAPILSDLRARYTQKIFSETDRRIEYAVQTQFIKNHITLACAESCTGGRISSRLTQISGSSQYFLGGLVAYSDKIKQTALKVDSKTIDKYGAVSRETVLEMVQGILALFGSDYAIAVSGIAGPEGGSREKPVGTIWGSIGTKKGDLFKALIPLKEKQPREVLIDLSATYLLSHLWRYVQFQIPPFS